MTRVFNRSSEMARRRLLRNNRPRAEVLLWSALKHKQIANHRFRRQYSIGPYIVDFYCPASRLAIEVDGDSHLQPRVEEYDRHRQNYIESFGIRVVRVTNTEVYGDLDGVIRRIGAALGTPYSPPS